MRMWLRHHWLVLFFNILIAVEYVRLLNSLYHEPIYEIFYLSQMTSSGLWAIRLLLISLLITPLQRLTGWNWAIRLRKLAGLWAWAFAGLHFLIYAYDNLYDTEYVAWGSFKQPYFIYMGVFSLTVLTLMGITSNRFAMRKLKKNWKRLHRLVYAAGVIAISHAILALAQSKKFTPELNRELYVYLVLLIILLALRIPAIRLLLHRAIHHFKRPSEGRQSFTASH